jgi:hypothetical protein
VTDENARTYRLLLKVNVLPDGPPMIISDLLYATLFTKCDAIFIENKAN